MALLAMLFVLAWERKWPLDLPGFDAAGVPYLHNLPAERLVERCAAVAIAAYALAGWPGGRRLLNGPRLVFAASLIGLLALAMLSPLWAIHPGLAAVHAGHLAIWVASALMVASADWPMARMAMAFLAGLLVHDAVGYFQVAIQRFVGLGPRFGEVPVRPEFRWASVVFAGPVRLLRAYGLSGHPNVLGGHIAAGLILAFGLVVAQPRFWRALIAIAWLMTWALLLITFSRSAWLALAVGGCIAGLLLSRGRAIDRRVPIAAATLAVGALIIGLGYVSIFRPFLVGRVDSTAQTFEAFSLRERSGMIEMAMLLIGRHPLGGVGAANFGVASREVLGYPLDWVHNVPLLIASELGLIGLAAAAAMLGSMLAMGWQHWRARSVSLWRALVGGALAALLTVMFFDHYLWTAPQGGLLWLWLSGCWMADL